MRENKTCEFKQGDVVRNMRSGNYGRVIALLADRTYLQVRYHIPGGYWLKAYWEKRNLEIVSDPPYWFSDKRSGAKGDTKAKAKVKTCGNCQYLVSTFGYFGKCSLDKRPAKDLGCTAPACESYESDAKVPLHRIREALENHMGEEIVVRTINQILEEL